MKTFLVMFLFLTLLGPARGSEEAWKKYANARFGFVLTYPATLIAGREAMNGDGREFHSADGEFSLAAFAHFFVPDSGDSFDGRWKEELETPDAKVTYKKKTPNWRLATVRPLNRSGDGYCIGRTASSRRGTLVRLWRSTAT